MNFGSGQCVLKDRPSNMLSAEEHPEIVTDYLREELALGWLVELNAYTARSIGVHTSPFGVIPKKGKPNKWRLILDLSSPDGHSVNDGISKELASLSYASVDEVVTWVLQLGQGAMMAKNGCETGI